MALGEYWNTVESFLLWKLFLIYRNQYGQFYMNVLKNLNWYKYISFFKNEIEENY